MQRNETKAEAAAQPNAELQEPQPDFLFFAGRQLSKWSNLLPIVIFMTLLLAAARPKPFIPVADRTTDDKVILVSLTALLTTTVHMLMEIFEEYRAARPQA